MAVAIVVWLIVPKPTGTPVVVASTAVQAGAKLTASHLQVRYFPQDLVPTGARSTTDDLVDSTCATALTPGMPVTDSVLVAATPHLADGHVRVPVSIADEAVSSVLTPGLHVRVYSTAAESPAAQDPTAGKDGALVNDAVVIAVTRTDPGGIAGGSSVVTLAVPAASAARLAASAGAGLGFALLN